MTFKGKLNMAFLVATALLFSGCLTSKKMDAYVAEQFNNKLPRIDRKKNPDITIFPSSLESDKISTTKSKTSHVLPLILYWQYDYRHTCTMNRAIGVANFANTIHSQVGKGLNQKLNGQKLELNVEQVPSTFALVDKAHLIWVILYKISWDRVFVQPDFKDLVVSYKLSTNNAVTKSGKITIKNNEQNKNIRFFQSWKSATTEYLTRYNENMATMTKAFINEIMKEL